MSHDEFSEWIGGARGIRCGVRLLLCGLFCLAALRPADGQDLFAYHGDPIPADIERMYIKGLDYLVKTQAANGTWAASKGSEPGVVGIAVLAMLAHGDDPNFGPYSQAITRALTHILNSADGQSGYIGTTMYNHGFATLALAALLGIYLMTVGGWPVALIGAASILAALAYSGGPFPLASHGLGDLFVFIFFGLVAVCGTYYVQALRLTPMVIVMSIIIFIIMHSACCMRRSNLKGCKTFLK